MNASTFGPITVDDVNEVKDALLRMADERDQARHELDVARRDLAEARAAMRIASRVLGEVLEKAR